MPGSRAAGLLPDIDRGRITGLERAMQRMERSLPPLQGFVLPDGHPSAAWAHIARTVCRRAERCVLNVAAGSSGGRVQEYYQEGLSYLFTLARLFNSIHGIGDVLWP